jgi:very-short-patch-repair endonuclease
MRAPPQTIAHARRLRRALSPPEARLWNRLRERAPGLPTFRRQHPIGPYVPDCYCAKARLAVEIDGMSHDIGGRPLLDIRRNEWLQARGVKVMRFAAGDVMRALDETVDGIVRMATALIEADAPHHRLVPLPRFAREDRRLDSSPANARSAVVGLRQSIQAANSAK